MIQTDYRARRQVRPSPPTGPTLFFKRLMAELWMIGAVLAFMGLDLIGINEPDARFLIVLVAALLSVDILAGAICLLKGHTGIGLLALTAWLVLPIGVAISGLVFDERWTAEFFGALAGTAMVLVVAAPAVAIARGRPQFGSLWDRKDWRG